MMLEEKVKQYDFRSALSQKMQEKRVSFYNQLPVQDLFALIIEGLQHDDEIAHINATQWAKQFLFDDKVCYEEVRRGKNRKAAVVDCLTEGLERIRVLQGILEEKGRSRIFLSEYFEALAERCEYPLAVDAWTLGDWDAKKPASFKPEPLQDYVI